MDPDNTLADIPQEWGDSSRPRVNGNLVDQLPVEIYKSANFNFDPSSSTHQNIIKANINSMRAISFPVAQFNKLLFKQILQDKKFGHFYRCIDQPYYDSIGRATFFVVKIANVVLPVYQPGTLMLYSAVHKQSDLAIVIQEHQQNKLVLGYSGALFLTKMLSKLASTYQLKCSQARKDVNSFYNEIYSKALDEVLDAFYFEDSRDHGVLIEIKDTLLVHTAPGRQVHRNPVVRLFYFKDLELLKVRKESRIEGDDDKIVEASSKLEDEKEEEEEEEGPAIIKKRTEKNEMFLECRVRGQSSTPYLKPIPVQDMQEITQYRIAAMVVPEVFRFFDGSELLINHFNKFELCLMNKKNLVPKDQEIFFKQSIHALSMIIKAQLDNFDEEMSNPSVRSSRVKRFSKFLKSGSKVSSDEASQGPQKKESKIKGLLMNPSMIREGGNRSSSRILRRDQRSESPEAIKPRRDSHTSSNLFSVAPASKPQQQSIRYPQGGFGFNREKAREDASLFTMAKEERKQEDESVIVSQAQINEQYVQNALRMNIKLKNYYDTLRAGLDQLLIHGCFIKSQSATLVSFMNMEAFFTQMTNLFPRLKDQFAEVGFKKLQRRAVGIQLKKVSYLFDEQESKICSEQITKKLLLRRRKYIQILSHPELKEFYAKGLKKLQNFFLPKRANPQPCQILLGAVDACLVAGFSLLLVLSKYHNLSFDQQTEVFSQDITKIFFGHIYYKTVSDPPEPELGEQPDRTRRNTQISTVILGDRWATEIPEQFFIRANLPRVMRKKQGEDHDQYKQRCKDQLMVLGDHSFKELIQFMDPTDPMKAFFNTIMTEVLKERIHKKPKGCEVF